MKKVSLFIFCLVICFVAAALGSLATLPEIATWYTTIRKPSFDPPNGIFGPVWSVLYFLMSVALYKLIVSENPTKNKAIVVFVIQLILNVIWSFIFFKWHLLTLASIEILILLALIIYFMVIARPISRIASYCFIPYVIWVSFASLLTISVAVLNQ